MSFETIFWDAAVVARFKAETEKAVASLQCPPGSHLVLVDLRGAILQSQDTIAAAQGIVGGSMARKIALVAKNTLARMQTKRLQIRENVLLFETLEYAEAWLFDQEDGLTPSLNGR